MTGVENDLRKGGVKKNANLLSQKIINIPSTDQYRSLSSPG